MAEEKVTYSRVRDGKTQIVTRTVRAHGQSRTPLYRRWKAMRERCENPNTHNYRWYGGRGICVCPEWREWFAFRDWANAAGYAPGMELDRINNDGPYSPENCRFVTKLENLDNRSRYLPKSLELRLRAKAAADNVSVYVVIKDALEAYLPPDVAEGGDAK